MLIALNTGKKRNAMTESYKDIMNEFSFKKSIIAVVPCFYNENDFSDEFMSVIQERFSNSNKIVSIFKAFMLGLKLRNTVKKNNIRKVFIYFDNDWFNIVFNICLTGLKLEYYIWIHDPILHSGEGIITRIVRLHNLHFMYHKAKKIFISYESIKEYLTNKLNYDPLKIVPIKLPEMKELEFDELRKKEIEINDYKYDLIFFGRIEVYKGIDLFIESIDYLKKEYNRSLNVIIAGTGDYEKEVQRKLGDRIDFTFINRYVDNRELAEFIINSRLVVMPYKDATGTQAIQVANYYNKPVIASRVGCFPEYIENGINGLLIDDYSTRGLAVKIIEGLDNLNLYINMKNKTPKYFKDNFRINTMVMKLEKELVN